MALRTSPCGGTAKSAGIGVDGGDDWSEEGGKSMGFSAETVLTAPNAWATLDFGWARVVGVLHGEGLDSHKAPLVCIRFAQKRTRGHKYRSILDVKCVRTAWFGHLLAV